VATGCGNLYVTINVDEEAGLSNFLPRWVRQEGVLHLNLRQSPACFFGFRSGIEVKSIIEQLRNIRCPSPSWEKGQRIFSCADAIARVIERRLLNSQSVKVPLETAAIPMKHSYDDEPIPADLGHHADIVGVCPDCGGALRHEEGCVKCHACGFSKC